jgi:hypothetical protein
VSLHSAVKPLIAMPAAMPAKTIPKNPTLDLVHQNYLFRGLDATELAEALDPAELVSEKLYSNRPIYTAYRPGVSLQFLYVIVGGGPVVVRSSPLDRVIAIHYPQSCFGFESLSFGFGPVGRRFPSLVEAYKTTDVLKIPAQSIQTLYENNETFRDRYNLLFELREKFEYHLLNCSTYPPQAVAALLRSLIYQERELGNQPSAEKVYTFDLSIDIIARASQLNHRTVEQVLKGMEQKGLIETGRAKDLSGDTLHVLDPEGMKEVYSTTRDKVAWWPLK